MGAPQIIGRFGLFKNGSMAHWAEACDKGIFWALFVECLFQLQCDVRQLPQRRRKKRREEDEIIIRRGGEKKRREEGGIINIIINIVLV